VAGVFVLMLLLLLLVLLLLWAVQMQMWAVLVVGAAVVDTLDVREGVVMVVVVSGTAEVVGSMIT